MRTNVAALLPSGWDGSRHGAPASTAAGTDSNRDGRISRAEFRADAMRFFAVLDSDHDSVIVSAEVRHYETEIAPDITGDNPGARERGYIHRHGSRDGNRHANAAGDAPANPRASDPAYDESLDGAGRFGLPNIPEPVISADLDMNRSITPAEFAGAADRRFALLDTNGDNLLDHAELAPFGAARRPGRRHH